MYLFDFVEGEFAASYSKKPDWGAIPEFFKKFYTGLIKVVSSICRVIENCLVGFSAKMAVLEFYFNNLCVNLIFTKSLSDGFAEF